MSRVPILFPPRIPAERIERALRSAERRGDFVLVDWFAVPDHWTRSALIPWQGKAALNRLGLAELERVVASAGR